MNTEWISHHLYMHLTTWKKHLTSDNWSSDSLFITLASNTTNLMDEIGGRAMVPLKTCQMLKP